MKIEITPKTLEEFRSSNAPLVLSISTNSMMFSVSAQSVLVLKQGSSFLLEFEDGIFYLKDDDDGFMLGKPTGKHKLMRAYCAGIAKYIAQFMKEKQTTYEFSIGELKFSKRALTLIKGKKETP